MRSFHLLRLCLALLMVLSSTRLDAYGWAPEIVVRLFESHPGLATIKLLAPFQIVRPGAREIRSGTFDLSAYGSGVRITSGGRVILESSEITVRPSSGHAIAVIAAGKLRHYRGALQFSSQHHSDDSEPALVAVNTVATKEYVESVVGSETEPDWPAEAIKAQAVLSQTVVARLKPGETIGDSTQRELYLGCDYIRPSIPACVNSVWHEILTFNRAPAIIFYSSTCAGMTSNGTDVFGTSAKGLTYLTARKCDYCKNSPFWKETVTRIKADKFATVFGEALPTVDAKDDAGRPTAMTFSVGGKRQQLSGYQFWMLMGQKFGWDKAPGLRFSLSRQGDYIVVRSTGAGHGVGLCNWGAAAQARLGRTYKQILAFYFPGCVVSGQGR